MTEFIDRAKLEAAMLQVDVAHFASKKPHPTVEDYATAVLALLDAETTEEWGVADEVDPILVYTQDMHGGAYSEASARNESMARTPREYVVSRRVTPWLPSEGGEN